MAETEAVMAEAYLGEDGAFQEDWLGNLPEDTFEKDDTGKLKQGNLGDHKTLASLAKSTLELEKKLGTSVQPLGEKPTDEQVKAHRAKVGCPDTVEGYEVAEPPDLPKGLAFDKELIKSAAQYSLDNHVPKGVFEGLVKLVLEGQANSYKQAIEARTAESDKTIAAAENQLKGKHGAKYDEFLETAKRFYVLPGNNEVNKAFTDLMAEKGLDSHPAVLEFFHEAYKLVKDDTIPGGGAPSGVTVQSGQLDYSKVVGNQGR